MNKTVIFGLLLLCTFKAQAGLVEISGSVGSSTWVTGDTIRVTGDIVVGADDHLTIQKGVRVEFTGAFNFTVNGKLTATGAKDEEIVFTAQNPAVDSLRWKGIRFVQSTPGCEIVFCIIEHSWARGTWPETCGGALYVEGNSPSVSRCVFRYNDAEGEGGAVYCWFTSSTFRNNLFYKNRSERFGGAIFSAYSNPQFINNTIVLNEASGWGGGLYAGAESAPVLVNCIISQNLEELELGNTRLTIGDDFSADLARARSGLPQVTFSCVTPLAGDPYPGSGNISDTIFFKNTTVEPYDFHLEAWSPCIDSGDPLMNASGEPDIRINRINMGAYGGTSEATLSLPVIQVRARSVGFSNVRINTSSSQDITVKNIGHYRMLIDTVLFTSGNYIVDLAETDAGLVPGYKIAPVEPGEQLKFSILFQPDELDDYTDTLFIYSTDTTKVISIPMTGTGINPIAFMRDDELAIDYSQRQIGVEHRIPRYIKNTGQSNLILTDATIQTEDIFRIVFVKNGQEVEPNGNTSDDNLTIAPRDSGLIRLIFKPDSPQDWNEPASVKSNDKNILFLLTGTGDGPSMRVAQDSVFIGYVYFNGDQASTSIQISNVGAVGDTLIVSETVVQNTAAFSTDLPPEGLRIPKDSTAIINVIFDPPAQDIIYESLVFIRSSNYPVQDTVKVVGRGMANPGRYVFGHVTGVWTWTTGSADFIILDSVYVPAQQKLKIEAGARILFEPDAKFVADGAVRIAGTSEDSVYFLPRDPSGDYDKRWNGMELNLSDASRLSYTVIKGSRYGLQVHEASPTVEFCTISDNTVAPDDSLLPNGGGVYMENAGTRLAGCIIENNSAVLGGGIYILNSVPVISNCIIRNNHAAQGGGVYMRFQSNSIMRSNLIYNNTAVQYGGGITVVEHSTPRIVNNTIVNNVNGGVYSGIRSVPALVNTIVWNNGSAITLAANGLALVSYSDIQGGFVGTRNLDTDPMFIDDNFNLADNSPLIDAGNPEDSYRDWYRPPSKGTKRNDIGAYGGSFGGTWEMPLIGISVAQNPAFPRWLNIYTSAIDTFDTEPVCRIETGSGESSVNMQPIDGMSYRTSTELSSSGTVFIELTATIAGQEYLVGRSIDVIVIRAGEELTSIIGGDGMSLNIPAGNILKNSMIIATPVEDAIPSTEYLTFLSEPVSISGLTSNLSSPVELSIVFENPFWSRDDIGKMSFYYLDQGNWNRIDGAYSDGSVKGFIDRDGTYVLALDESFENIGTSQPVIYDLLTAYPNPFNSSIKLNFNLQFADIVTVEIFDISGRLVESAFQGNLVPGSHSIVWDGRNHGGLYAPSGVYFAKLTTTNISSSIKLLLVR